MKIKKIYYFYILEFNNGNDEWEIKDVTSDKNDFNEEVLKEDFNSEINPKCKSYEIISKKEFKILKRFL